MKLLSNIPVIFFIILMSIMACNTAQKKPQITKIPENLVENTLIKHYVSSDGHPMAVWEKKTDSTKGLILFLHGGTWSSVPDFHLQVEGEDLSLMNGMAEQGYSSYAVDLRGYGATPRDSTEWVSPSVAVNDINNVLNWISKENKNKKVHLFGWSMGSTLSLLTAQKNDEHIASLTVFGYWQDLDLKIPETTKYTRLEKSLNTAENAASDFITPGSISPKAIETYVKKALKFDPIKVDWRNESEYNYINPSEINTPVLILQGEFDPFAPTERQEKLFKRLKTVHKSWIVIRGGDHAAFLEKPRKQFINSFTEFINRFN